MTKAAELAKMGEVLTNSQIGGRRNLIINGAMQVAQRGTSFTSAGYTLDRFNLSLSGATGTVTQESFALDSEIAGLKNFLKLDVTTGNNFCGIQHRIEDVDTIKGGEIYTISFYAKGTNSGGGNLALRGRQSFGSGGSTEVITFTESITLTSSWQRFSFTKTQSSLSGKTIGTGSYFELFFHQPELDTSTNAWELNITGVQLEVGEQATPFEHRSFGEELALCQRYFYAHADGTRDMAEHLGMGTYYTSTSIFFSVSPKVSMRATPTLEAPTGTNYYIAFSNSSSDHFDALTLSARSSQHQFEIEGNTNASGTVGHGTLLRLGSTSNTAKMFFDAEL